MTISISPLMPDPIIQCMASGRDPTGPEQLEVAKRIWTDGAAGRSASGWGRLPPDSRDRLVALRHALLALHGDDDWGAEARKEKEEAHGSVTSQSAGCWDRGAKGTQRKGKALGLQRLSRRARLALSNFSRQFDRDNLHSRFLTVADNDEDHQQSASTEPGDPRLENFVAIEPHSNRILAIATVAIERSTNIAKAVLVIRPKFEKGKIRWRLLDQVARFAASSGVKMLEAIENRKDQGELNLECHAGWSAAPYRIDPTLMVLRKTLSGIPG